MSRKKFVGSNLIFKATSRDHCSGLWAGARADLLARVIAR
jgi:hypothetical protein